MLYSNVNCHSPESTCLKKVRALAMESATIIVPKHEGCMHGCLFWGNKLMIDNAFHIKENRLAWFQLLISSFIFFWCKIFLLETSVFCIWMILDDPCSLPLLLFFYSNHILTNWSEQISFPISACYWYFVDHFGNGFLILWSKPISNFSFHDHFFSFVLTVNLW